MTTSKKTSASKTTSSTSKINAARKAKDENVAQVAFDRVKEAVPSIESVASTASDVSDYIQDTANVDLQRMADDASKFVRRNPGASLAAAAGLGILIGVLASKRS